MVFLAQSCNTPICSIGNALAEIDDIFVISGKDHPNSQAPSKDCQRLPSQTSPPPLNERWDEIERFVAEIADLAQSTAPRGEFSEQVLQRTSTALHAISAAVWFLDADECWTLEKQGDFDKQGDLETQGTSYRQSRPATGVDAWSPTSAVTAMLDRVRDSGKPIAEPHPDASGRWLTASPLKLERQTVGVLAVLHESPLEQPQRSGVERLLAIVADLFGNYLRRQEIRTLRVTSQRWRLYEHLVTRVQSSLDLRTVAFALVNDGRVYLGCDRVVLLVSQRGNFRVMGISGVDSFQRRSGHVQVLENLAGAVATSGHWLRYRGDDAGLPPQLAEPLGDYLDLSHAARVDVVPLYASPSETVGDLPNDESGQLVGVLMVETFRSEAAPLAEDELSRVVGLAAIAVRNALDYGSLPLLSAARHARRISKQFHFQRRRWVLWAAALTTVAGSLWWIPARVRVDATGDAWPQIRRELYAPQDGEVIDVLRDHEQTVAANETLIVLRSPDLDLELQKTRGEFQTTQKKLLAIASARMQSDSGNLQNRSPGQLAAEEQELKQLLESQTKQLDLMRQRREQLVMRSPIAGRVLTWNPRERLANRPVERGQLLLSIADESGPWILELLVPENQAGHLLDARAARRVLPVTFSPQSERGTRFTGEVVAVAARTEIADSRSLVRVTVSVPEHAVDSLRPGARVIAKIDCGTRSLGFVCFDGLLQHLKGWLL